MTSLNSIDGGLLFPAVHFGVLVFTYAGLLVLFAGREQIGAGSEGNGDPDRKRDQIRPVQLTMQRQRNADAHNVHDGERHKKLPAKPHELIEPVPRKGEPQQHKNLNVGGYFKEKPEWAVNPRFRSGKQRTGGRNHWNREYGGQDQAQQTDSGHEHFLNRDRLLGRSPETVASDPQHEQQRKVIEEIEEAG